MGRRYLAAYFHQIHPRYPFVDPDDIWALHCERSLLAATPAARLTKPQRFGLFKLYMAYAIGAMLLQPSEKPVSSPPEVRICNPASRTVTGHPFTSCVAHCVFSGLLYGGTAAHLGGA